MATASSQRAATVPFQGLPQPGRKKGTQLGWGQWAGGCGVGQPVLDAASRLYIGHLPAHTPLLGQTQSKQGRSQERKRRAWHSWTGEGRDTASLGPESKTDTSAFTLEGLGRLNIQRDEHVSFGSCIRTQGREEAGRGWDTPGSSFTKPSPTNDNGIAWNRPEPVLPETQGKRIHHSPGENSDL